VEITFLAGIAYIVFGLGFQTGLQINHPIPISSMKLPAILLAVFICVFLWPLVLGARLFEIFGLLDFDR
jgi:hypothetical protein